LKRPPYRRLLVLVFAATALLSFVVVGLFMFSLVAGVTEDLAGSAAADPAKAELARLIARGKVVSAAGKGMAFLLAQALLQVAALVVSSFVATRGLDAEFRRMSALISDQERRLEEAAALSGWKEIASFLSHQLKNPLAAVDLSASNARLPLSRSDCAPGSGILSESLESIQEDTARMKALIGRLKSLTAFEQAAFKETSLAEAALEAAGRYPSSRAEVSVSGAAAVLADRDLIVQALVNLMDNSAEEAERAGASPARIRVGISPVEGGARIEYEDDGRTLDPAVAARLGRERFTTKRTGSGLGLLFSSRIMSIHGGGLEIEAGRGGSFRAVAEIRASARGIGAER